MSKGLSENHGVEHEFTVYSNECGVLTILAEGIEYDGDHMLFKCRGCTVASIKGVTSWYITSYIKPEGYDAMVEAEEKLIAMAMG